MTTSPSPTLVRAAQPAEAAELAWLAALTFPLACPPGTAAEEIARHVATHLSPTRFAELCTSRAHRLLVAEGALDGNPPRLRGYALLRLGAPEGDAEARAVGAATGTAGPVVELSKIYVHPAELGSGVAGALLRAAVAAADELAAAHGHPPLPLWLGTNGRNERAQAFYRKHGFVVVGSRTYDVGGQQHDDVVMLRQG